MKNEGMPDGDLSTRSQEKDEVGKGNYVRESLCPCVRGYFLSLLSWCNRIN